MDERDWRLIWASWAAAFIVAETIALRSGQKHAPLSYHMRKALGVHRQPLHRRLGQCVYASSAAWLAVHLYRSVTNDKE